MLENLGIIGKSSTILEFHLLLAGRAVQKFLMPIICSGKRQGEHCGKFKEIRNKT
jgi:hypothetical protein